MKPLNKYLPILLILLSAAVLRTVNINQSLWLDEATTALTTNLNLSEFLTSFIVSDFHPPLYYLLLKVWALIFGNSEVALRTPSLVFGVGTVYVIYLIAYKLFNYKAGIVAALLLATNGLAVYYSQEARSYSMTMFLVSYLVYLFINHKWLLFSIVLAFTGMTDYVALFVLPALWLFGFKNKKFWLSHMPLFVVYLIWSPILINQLLAGIAVKERLPGWWGILGTLTIKNLLLFPIKFITGRVGIFDHYMFTAGFTAALLANFLLLIKIDKRHNLLLAWVLVPPFIGIMISYFIPTLTYFRYLFCLPGFVILIAGLLSDLSIKKTLFFTPVLLAVNIITTTAYIFLPEYHRENWRGLVAFVEPRKTENSVTIFNGSSNMEAYLYYAPNAKITGPGGINSNLESVWLMDYLTEIYDPEGKIVQNLNKNGFSETGKYSFNQLGVTEYRRALKLK